MPRKRQPTPQADAGNWGVLLNEHLSQTKNPANGAFNVFEEFSQRPSNLTADDEGKTLLHAQTGNWHQWTGLSWRVYDTNGVVNVRDYGARGDGSTDDTLAIQAALETSRRKRLPLLVPAGEFITETVSLQSNDMIFGINKQTSSLVYPRTTGDLLKIATEGKYITIQNLTLKTKALHGSGWAFNGNGKEGQHQVFRDCEVLGFYNGFLLSNGLHQKIEQCYLVSGEYVNPNRRNGTAIQIGDTLSPSSYFCTTTFIEHVYIGGGYIIGIDFFSASRCHLICPVIEYCTTAITSTGPTNIYNQVFKPYFEGNSIDMSTDLNIGIETYNGSVQTNTYGRVDYLKTHSIVSDSSWQEDATFLETVSAKIPKLGIGTPLAYPLTSSLHVMNLPTSPAGLTDGALYADSAGFVKIFRTDQTTIKDYPSKAAAYADSTLAFREYYTVTANGTTKRYIR